QVLAGPLLSVANNSPMLFGKRLWAETRIALFQQSVDTRSETQHQRNASPRVSFGTQFLTRSIVELFREDIVRHRTLVGTDFDEDPQAVLDRGEIPQLKALRLHNGTIYRWNRACYGIMNGIPHLRIENRVMPAGPSVADQVANAAFWCGLMVELGDRYEDITQHTTFDHAQSNFFAAAREGIGAQMCWLDGRELPANQLVLEELLPIAEKGLSKHGVIEADIKRYLGIVEKRVRSGKTGTRWLLASLQGMKNQGSQTERQHALVSATLERQKDHKPVAEWELATLSEATKTPHSYKKVHQCMTTDLATVHADDAVDLVANLMSWDKIRHVMVEDRDHHLIGVISSRSVLRFLSHGGAGRDAAVSEIMKTDVVTVGPETTTLEAIHLMRKHRIGCLPVLDGERKLVGVVTEENFLRIAGELLEKTLQE
ncbi:MAG: CBS domain-containing protein, partial [Myxococcaceae bacterium]